MAIVEPKARGADQHGPVAGVLGQGDITEDGGNQQHGQLEEGVGFHRVGCKIWLCTRGLRSDQAEQVIRVLVWVVDVNPKLWLMQLVDRSCRGRPCCDVHNRWSAFVS